MNFHLSDEQVALQDAVQRHARESLDGGLRRAVFEGADGFDASYWRGLMDMGVGGITIDEAHGGMGLGLVDLALVAEVLGYEAAPGPFLGHVLAARAIQAAGSAAQKARWLPLLARGQAVGTVALGEPGDRWAPSEWGLALRQGRLSGTKSPVLYPALADVMVVGTEGGGLALVEPKASTVTAEALDGVDRTRRLGAVRLDGVAAEPLGAGALAAADLMDDSCVLLAADAFGGACRVLQMTVDYAKTRSQFGAAIGSFQGIKHRLANAACEVEPARGLYWYAALAQDQRQPDRSRIASLAKAHLADRFNATARTAVELHGGIGFTWEFDLQIWVKRAMFDFSFAATPARHRQWAMQADAVAVA
ncbi:MAG: acyl-CoA dehydrogenase family protein [Burkholderiaceae bacterium]|nr:acyl-CoA dehydrogenase family protein [Burkholderiaceae bacterium]